MKLDLHVLTFLLFLHSSSLLASPEEGAELKRYDLLRGMDAPIWALSKEVSGNEQLAEKFEDFVARGRAGDTDSLIAAACLASGIWCVEDAKDERRNTAQDQRAFKLMEEAAERGSATALTYLGTYFFFGIGVEINAYTGMQLLQRAVKAGSLRARRLYVAALLDKNLDDRVPEDDFLPALQTFANEGDPWALNAMGLKLSSGIHEDDFSGLSKAISYFHRGWKEGNAASAHMFAVSLRSEGYKSFTKEGGVEAYSQYIYFLKKYDLSEPQTELDFAKYLLFPHPYVGLDFYEFPYELLTALEQRTDLTRQIEMELYVTLYAYHTRIGELRVSMNSGQESGRYITKAWDIAKEIKPDEMITGAIALQKAINLIVGLNAEPDFDKALVILNQAENTGLPDIKLIKQFLEDEISVEQGLASCNHSCTFWQALRKFEKDYEAALVEEERRALALAQKQARNQAQVTAQPRTQKSGGGFKNFLKGVFKVAGFVLLIGVAVAVGGAFSDADLSYSPGVYSAPQASSYVSSAPGTFTPPALKTYAAPGTRLSSSVQFNAPTGCISDYSCGVGKICLKKDYKMSGVCVNSVNEFGRRTHNLPRSQSFEVGSGLPRCKSTSDCPIGTQCDVTYRVCTR